jgi:hypothetical protein
VAMIRWVFRIAILSVAIAIVIAILSLAVRSVPALSAEHLRQGFLGFRPYRRRVLEPQPWAFADFALKLALVGLVALVGKVLRLRL